MIKRLKISNFKSIQEIEMKCENLNLFIGTNSSGKSTVNQAVLLVGQNMESPVGLNGNFTMLGEFEENKCRYSTDREIRIGVIFSDDKELWNTIKRNEESDSLELRKEWSEHTEDFWREAFNVKKRNIQYLSCHRIGPQNWYNKNMLIDDMIGNDGEYAVSYLNKHKTDIIEEKLRRTSQDYTLMGQVNWWLNYIVGAQISTEEILGTNLIKASYQMNDMPNIRPVNIGSGVSYLISILIMCLSSPDKGIIIIENPEIHLHPAAQSKICEFLYFTAESGRQLFVETHSDHIFNGFRAGISNKQMDKNKVNIQFMYLNDNHLTENMRVEIGKYGVIENQRENLFDQFDIDLNKMIGI